MRIEDILATEIAEESRDATTVYYMESVRHAIDGKIVVGARAKCDSPFAYVSRLGHAEIDPRSLSSGFASHTLDSMMSDLEAAKAEMGAAHAQIESWGNYTDANLAKIRALLGQS